MLPTITLELNAYQIANLKSLIEACGYSASTRIRNPLWVANTGDWIGEIYKMIPANVECEPNATAEQLAERANNYMNQFQVTKG